MSVVDNRLEKQVKRDFEQKIKALRKKAEEFERQGNLERAERCRFLAKHLELFVEKEVNVNGS